MKSGVKLAAGWIAVSIGLLFIYVSALTIDVNYLELGPHSCSNPEPYPVCGSIYGVINEFILIALLGSALFVAGVFLIVLGRKHRKAESESVAL